MIVKEGLLDKVNFKFSKGKLNSNANNDNILFMALKMVLFLSSFCYLLTVVITRSY